MRKIIIAFLSLMMVMPVYGASLINDTETEKLLYKLVEPLATAANIPDGRLKIYIIKNVFIIFYLEG